MKKPINVAAGLKAVLLTVVLPVAVGFPAVAMLFSIAKMASQGDWGTLLILGGVTAMVALMGAIFWFSLGSSRTRCLVLPLAVVLLVAGAAFARAHVADECRSGRYSHCER